MSSTEMEEIGKAKKRRGSGSSASTSKSHGEVDVEEGANLDDPGVSFIQPNHADPEDKMAMPPITIEFTGLTKDELMKFATDPFWKKVRWVLFILFWVLWIAMLVAAILIIVLTPKCPKIPKQTFWQKSSGYHVDVATFKDSDGDGIGDIKGVVEKIDYLKTKGGFLVLSSVIEGSLGDDKVRSTAITNFQNIDPRVGKLDDVNTLMKKCRQNGMKAVIEFSPHTGKSHEWFKKAEKGDKTFKDYYIMNTDGSSQMRNRVGKPVWNKIKDKLYYWSSFHETLPALNLNNSAVVKELSDAVTFWLTKGFDGVFIDNAAFLAPETDEKDIGVGAGSLTATKDLAKWYKTGHKGQLYTDGSVRFIQEVRKAVDAVLKKTDRERLLLVSSGNTGLEQNREKTLAYLGDADTPGAHSVVLFDLVPEQGRKVIKSSKAASSLRDLVDAAMKVNSSVMTVTQTLSGPRSDDFVRTCLNLLLPTTGLTLYGEEIGMTGYGKDLSEKKMYPKPAYWYITKAAMENKAVFVDDLVDSYDVPMQWKLEGGFSTANATYKKTFPDQNEMSLSTIGRGQTRLDVFTGLVKLSKEHSLNWGEFEWLETKEEKDINYFMFSRSAKGFSTYIVIVTKPTKMTGGRARDLSKVCKEATPVLSFPSIEDFKESTAISMANVYFHFNEKGSVYVFKCKK